MIGALRKRGALVVVGFHEDDIASRPACMSGPQGSCDWNPWPKCKHAIARIRRRPCLDDEMPSGWLFTALTG